jgi:hypothetical protein
MANNLFADVPAAAVARQNVDFSAAGFDTSNTRIIYEVGSPLKSWVPGRAINSISGFTLGKGYYIVPKVDMDKTTYLIPPIPAGGGATTLNAPTGLTLGTATSTTQPLSWTDTNTSPNENGYKVHRNTTNNFGTSTLVTTTAANATSYTVTGLTAGTLYYYWIVAAGDGTTTGDSAQSTVASGSTSAGGTTAANLLFNATGSAGLLNASQIFTPDTGDASWGAHLGLDPLHLPANTSGRVYFKKQASGDTGVVLGFNTSNAAANYDGMPAGIIDGTTDQVQRVEGGGTAGSAIAGVAGKWYGIFRDGSTGACKTQISDDAITWTDLDTLSFTSTAILYVVCSLYGAGSTKMTTPKGEGLV